ncbi:MAG TPA: hypothetical protein VFB35_04200 [Gaiellaceae bacterium]|nr:hypothetical protein [Gaiellaceae bacterium]
MLTARGVDEAHHRLQELRQDEWSDLALGIVALGMAVAATAVSPPLAVPLLLGGIFLSGLGIRALILRWELFDELLADSDAYTIPEVRTRAVKAASMASRRECARALRHLLDPPGGYPVRPHVAAVSERARDLIRDLEDESLVLEPWCAVSCERLVTRVEGPLFDETRPPEDLLALINRVESGFHRPLAA